MNRHDLDPRAFTLVLLRPSVFWLGLFAVGSTLVLLALMGDPDFPGYGAVDVPLLAVLLLPGVTGLLAGAALRELQAATFSWVLPAVRRRSAAGFVLVGAGLSLAVSAAVLAAGTRHHPVALLALGLLAWCLGSQLNDGLARWRSLANGALALALVAGSTWLGQLAVHHPWSVAAAALALAALYLWRAFAAGTFRARPFRLTAPLPGAFSFRRQERIQWQKLGPVRNARSWPGEKLGTGLRTWLRAAFYETHGAGFAAASWRAVNALWPLLAVVALDAWTEMGSGSFGHAYAESAYHSLFAPPHLERFGGDPPYAMVAIVVAAVAGILSIFYPITLRASLLYPLSRRQRARLAWRGGQLEAALVLVGVGTAVLAAGLLAGAFAGHPLRLDFVPLGLRALLVSLALLPGMQLFRLLALAEPGSRENTSVAVMFALWAFVVGVCALTFLPPWRALPPPAELAGLAALIIASQLGCRALLARRFAADDL